MASTNRATEIAEVIKTLEHFRANPNYQDRQYAINENIAFLKAIRTIFRYIKWLLTRAGKINGQKLLELTDFPVPEWDIKMHRRLIQIERNKHIKLGKPLVDAILEFIVRKNQPLVLANLGAGGMEVDRQVILGLREKKWSKPIIIVGVDNSPVTHEIARDNIDSLNATVNIQEIDYLTFGKLENIKKINDGITVILCKNDIFDLDKDFPTKCFDLSYNSLFRHHLTLQQQDKLDAVLKKISKNRIEYEGYRTWKVVVQQTIVAWNYIHFLEASIFSNLRFNTKSESLNFAKQRSGEINFYSTGHYLLKYNDQ